MADYCSFSVAAMSALDKEPEDFLNAYVRNRGDAHALTLEASVVAPFIQRLIDNLPTGQEALCMTATELLAMIDDMATEQQRKSKDWPDKAVVLSNALKRIKPNLFKAGIEVEFLKREGTRRPIRISRVKIQEDSKEW